jgi:hypothetical protein
MQALLRALTRGSRRHVSSLADGLQILVQRLGFDSLLLETLKKQMPVGLRTVCIFRCDQCAATFERLAKKTRVQRPLHFCSLQCANIAQKKGGVLDAVRTIEFKDRLGVAYPMQSAAVRAKTIATCQSRYGVDNVQQVADIKQRSCLTFLARLEDEQQYHGVWTSKQEDAFFECLVRRFGREDVVRQKRAPAAQDHRVVDFYMKSIDTYVQFDGAYWHGLDRPIDVIEKSDTQRDKDIARRWRDDRAQDVVFAAQKLRLVRVTDVEFKNMGATLIETKVCV